MQSNFACSCVKNCQEYTGLDEQSFECKIVNIFITTSLKYVLGAQKNRLHKNRLMETVLLSSHNICFGEEI